MLLDKISMQNAGCQLDRNELRDQEWIMLGIIRSELNTIGMEEREKMQRG